MLTVILAGGASRRMGRDKAMLGWNGTTMLQSLIDKYSAKLGTVAVCVNETGRFAFSGASEIVDEFPGQGPVNGIVSAFSRTDADMIFMTATDLPFGDAELVNRLKALIGEHDACMIRRADGKIETLFALYKRSCFAPAKHCLGENRRSVMSLLDNISVRYVEEGELPGFDLKRIFANLNTEEEYLKYLNE